MATPKKKKESNFTEEQQELLRKFLFTAPNSDVSFVYPQELVAGEELSPLMSAYSRTHIPMQDRILQFLDSEKTEQTQELLPIIPKLMDIFRHPDGTLKTSKRTTNFNKEWVIGHGHSSIKEETQVFFYCENISDITGKKITGHPLNRPQGKSSRYMSFGKTLDLSLQDKDIATLPDADGYFDHIKYMHDTYLEKTKTIADLVANSPYTTEAVEYMKSPEIVEAEVLKRVERQQNIDDTFAPSTEWLEKERERYLKGLEKDSVRKDVEKFVLDRSRVYLMACDRISNGSSADARTVEDIITDLISSQRIEDRELGHKLWAEAKKIAPVLLGEKSHIKVDEWRIKNETELRTYLEDKLGYIEPKNYGKKMVNIMVPNNTEMYTDRFNAANVVFPYTDAALWDIQEQLTDSDVADILERAHRHRGKHDVIHPAISHGGLMIEAVMPYHAYRDIFRHRRGSRSTQLLTTKLGFEMPEIFKIFGIDKDYMKDMQKCSEVYEKARKTSPHIAEKLIPFSANCRALHSWQVNQVGYVGKLRGDISKGNVSYVYMAREMIDAVTKYMPETAKYFKIDRQDYPEDLWKNAYKWFDAVKRPQLAAA